MNLKIVGCITSSPLKEGYIPHHLQNLLIKNFVENSGSSFLLSWTEYKSDPFLACRSLLTENFYGGICFYSIEQLLLYPQPLQFLYDIRKKNIWVGFAKENTFFNDQISFDSTLKLWWLIQCISLNHSSGVETKMSPGKLQNFVSENHLKTTRDYSLRGGPDKDQLSIVAKKFGYDYWDGERKYGYGGFKNDGRWLKVAQRMISHYGLKNSDSILDIGCGKGYLLYEFKKLNPDFKILGVDISEYALAHSEPAVSQYLKFDSAAEVLFPEKSFDAVISINTLHNLELPALFSALEKIQSIKKNHAYICVESYRNQTEKWNLMRWQLTCECFFTPEEWVWIFKKAGYEGDYEFIFFE